ncbi:hypothetical protein AM629_06255 [Photorhabdus heterorhabditis]|uniref:Uncharacterized protein n=2 Tax=Photorhabdus heterorhabditis TaxID=880156 RepID=A0ABR5KE11_9GAMM|nr:hypothetical protein AM629_06255 [Photorhabdus heterorhabditis]
METMNNEPKSDERATSENEHVAPRSLKRKVTLEFELEKLLWVVVISGLVMAAVFFGYRFFSQVNFSSFGRSGPEIAVFDFLAVQEKYKVDPTVPANSNFDTYLRKLMALYRVRGYLVIDIKLTYTIPPNTKMVPYLSPADLAEELKSEGIPETIYEVQSR